MKTSGANSLAGKTLSIWADIERWRLVSDVLAILVVVTLPWSTSLPAIFIAIWLIVLVPTIDMPHLLMSLRRPACILPISFCMLALVGMLWSEVEWSARIHSASSSVKFLVLPLLIYHFERSARGAWVLVCFIVSCFLLMVMSWIVAYEPQFALKANAVYGVPVKNYIDQSQEFVFCTIVVAWPVLQQLKRGKLLWAAALILVALSFLINMLFVIVSRTALVCLPVLLIFFAVRYLNFREMLILAVAAIALIVTAWVSSPLLRLKAEAIFTDYVRYEISRASTSGGKRLEFWRKSLYFYAEAPFIGHGTGSTLQLFERAAVDQTGVSSEVVANPHNQTLYSAVQWGTVGVLVLFLMWFVHFRLFRGESFEAWVGSLIVAQTFVSSMFNSHLLDFHEGWMYVLGVGIAGGVVTKAASKPAVLPTHRIP